MAPQVKPKAVKLTSHRETYGLPAGFMVEDEAGMEGAADEMPADID